MKKSLAITMLAFLVAVAWSGAVAASDVTVNNNSLLSPEANALVIASGNSLNVNTNTNVVISKNVNTQLQAQNSPITLTVNKIAKKQKKHRHHR